MQNAIDNIIVVADNSQTLSDKFLFDNVIKDRLDRLPHNRTTLITVI